MTDRHPEDGAHEFDELEPLPEDAELEELSELPELPDLPELPETPGIPEFQAEVVEVEPPPAEFAAAEPAPAESSPEAAAGSGSFQPGMVKASTSSRRERMEKDREERKTRKKSHNWDRWPGPGEKPTRDMEQAPQLLRKAAWWLLIGCALPWGGGSSGLPADLLAGLAEKLLCAGGLYIWHQTHLLRDGTPTPGFIQKLGAKSFLPLFITAGVLALLGFLPLVTGDWGGLPAYSEKGCLLLAGLTYTHIYDYQHGGRFNPLFPIMFLAPGIAGVVGVFSALVKSESVGVMQIVGALGAALVSVAGWMAAYTMYVALKEAKAEGDRKKTEALEARKAARVTRKSP